MAEAEQMTAVARQRADKNIDAALGEVHRAAAEIGKKHGIPENIGGLSIEDLVGRMAWVPSMARELRMLCGQEMAKVELAAYFENAKTAAPLPGPKKKPETEVPQKQAPVTMSNGTDLGSIVGISAITVKALAESGITNVGEVVAVPDAHLVKMPGLGEKSVAHLRAAIANAAAAK